MRKLFIATFMFVSSFGSNVMADGHSIKDYTRVKTTWYYTSDEPSLDPFSIR